MSSSTTSGRSISNCETRNRIISIAPRFDRRQTAVSAQLFEDARAHHHRARERKIQRRQSERGVAAHLDGRAAVAEHHHRTELRVLVRADDQLDAAAPTAIGSTVKPSSRASGARLTHAAKHRLCRALHRVCVGQIENHATDVGLVRDVG